mgnify:FL=1
MDKIIVPMSYMGSGSSAVTDLLREYEGINTKNSDFEYVFLHAPNGLFDLEFKLLYNNNAIRSDEAVKSFRKLMKKLYIYGGWGIANYKHKISKNFMNIVDSYLDSIVTSKYRGIWYFYQKPSKMAWFIRVIRRVIFKKSTKLKQVELEMSMVSSDDFYEKSRKFILNVIKEISYKEEYMVLDQLLLPHNLNIIDNYKIEELFPIIISRDPRDVFIMNKYFWKPRNQEVPYPTDVKEFCNYYKMMRENEKKTNTLALRLNFEDLVLNYEETKQDIENFIGIDSVHHKAKFEYFNPAISVNNLQVYNRDDKYREEVEVIELELSEYLYNFKERIVSTGDVF